MQRRFEVIEDIPQAVESIWCIWSTESVMSMQIASPWSFQSRRSCLETASSLVAVVKLLALERRARKIGDEEMADGWYSLWV